MWRACRAISAPYSPVARTFRTARPAFAEEAKSFPKPKETTPLRKSAFASLPLRANATASRGLIRPVFIITTPSPYTLSHLRRVLPSGSQLFQDAFWVPRWGSRESEGEIFIFLANGSAVCWGLAEEESRRFAAEFLLSNKDHSSKLLEDAETEDLEFVTDPNEQVIRSPCSCVIDSI